MQIKISKVYQKTRLKDRQQRNKVFLPCQPPPVVSLATEGPGDGSWVQPCPGFWPLSDSTLWPNPPQGHSTMG